MENGNWPDNQNAGLSATRGQMLQRGLKVAARRGLTRAAVDKSAQLAERHLPQQLGRVFIKTQVGIVTRWVRLIEWAGFAFMLVFGLSGLWLTVNHNDNFFATFLLALAFVSFGVWWLVRRTRRFAEQQVLKALANFQQLVMRGELPATAWPQWFQQWRKNRKGSN